MFRVIDITDGAVACLGGGEERVGPPPSGMRRWIDLLAPEKVDLAKLGGAFGFHPLALEDCEHAGQRPKLEDYGSHTFVVTQGFELTTPEPIWHELHAFLGSDYLVTVHAEPIPTLDRVRARLERDPSVLQRGSDFLYYVIADAMVDENFPVLDALEDELEDLEEAVLQRPRQADLEHIFTLRRRLVTMRKILSPQRDVMALLARHVDTHVSEKTTPYFRDVYDHLVRIVESIEGKRDLLGNALEAYLSATSQRTNEIMKALALLSAIFMPLTFITGFFGQNFEHIPYGDDRVLTAMVACVVLTPPGMLLWFRSRRWF